MPLGRTAVGLTSKSSYKRWVLARNTINSGDWFLDSGDYASGNVRWQTKAQQVQEQMKKRALRATAIRKPPVSVGLEDSPDRRAVNAL